MKNMTIEFIAFFIAVPIFATIIMYYLALKIRGKKQKALHITVNLTTILYIIADNTLLYIIFGRSFYSWTVVLLLSVFSLILFIQWKTKIEVELGKGFKFLWRLSFLFFGFLYLCLIVAGLLQQFL